MFKLSITCLILFIALFGYSQDSAVDTLKIKVKQSEVSNKEKFSLLNKIVVFYKSNNADSAKKYSKAQLLIANEIGEVTLIVKGHNNLANAYFNKGDYANSIKHSLVAFELFKSLNDTEGQVNIICLMARVYASKNDFENAYKEYDKGFKILKGIDDDKLILPLYTGYGNTKFLEDKFAEAEYYFEKCLKIAQENPGFDSESIATIYTNLGNIQASYENDPAAIDYYKKSLGIYTYINDLYGMSLTQFNIGDSYLFMGQYDSAQYYFEQNLAIGKTLNSNEEIYYAYFGLTNLYTKQKNYEKALMYQVLSGAYKDSMLQSKYDNKVLELQKKYESVKNEKALEIAEIQIAESEENKKRDALTMQRSSKLIMYLWISAGILLVISSAIFYLYRMVSKSNVVIKNQNEKISHYNKEMDKTLAQKVILLKEVHHRVKNNLQIIASLLNLQMNRMDNESAKQAIEDSRNRVQAIATMHKGLYKDELYNKVDISNYLKDLVSNQQMFSFSGKKEINFNLKIDSILLSIDDAVPVGLILSELISNSAKHAFDDSIENPEINIEVTQLNDKINVIFKDNGVGLPNNFSLDQDGSLGFEIICALVEQLNGTIEIIAHHPFELHISF